MTKSNYSQNENSVLPPSSPGGSDAHNRAPYGAYLEFVNNVPVQRYNPPPDGIVTRQVAQSITTQIMSEPFNGLLYNPATREYEEVELPQFIGKPMKMVMDFIMAQRAALGDLHAYREINDRAYGKPVQESHNVSVDATQTYQQFLEELASQEQAIDVKPVQPQYNDDDLDALIEDF